MDLEQSLVYHKNPSKEFYSVFEDLELYLNGWYSNEEDLLKYIQESVRYITKLLSNLIENKLLFALEYNYDWSRVIKS